MNVSCVGSRSASAASAGSSRRKFRYFSQISVPPGMAVLPGAACSQSRTRRIALAGLLPCALISCPPMSEMNRLYRYGSRSMIKHRFLALRAPNRLAPRKIPSSRGNVEPRQTVRLICDFRARDIVNAVITLRDQSIDILDANFARVSQFERASRHESACDNAKRDRFEERLVRLIERAVDEHASAGERWHSNLAVSNH